MRGGKTLFLIALTVSVPLHAGSAFAAGLESSYTDISSKACKKMEADTEYEREKCGGIGGYRVDTVYGDQRQSIMVVSPQGKEFDLSYWEMITPGFSHLGDKAEWRIAQEGGKPVPKALIVRVYTKNDAGKEISYLAVAKVSPEKACVTDRIEGGPNANELARQAADASANKACLKPLP
jgi:hypothetical protein